MDIEPTEVYSKSSNVAVVRVNGRNYPGSVIQGDTLSSLFASVNEVASRLQASGCEDEELLYLVTEVQESLFDRLLHYQTVLKEHGISLPFAKAVEKSDVVRLVPEADDETL